MVLLFHCTPPPSHVRRTLEGAGTGDMEQKGNLSRDCCGSPLWAFRPVDDQGKQPLQHWPFFSADLHNWKTQNSFFSDNSKTIIDFLYSLLFSHQPTWGDCKQLLQVLFNTEKRQKILQEARKNVPGPDERPSLLHVESRLDSPSPKWGILILLKVASI